MPILKSVHTAQTPKSNAEVSHSGAKSEQRSATTASGTTKLMKNAVVDQAISLSGELDAVNQLRLHLTTVLQTTLDINELLQLFHNNLKVLLGTQGIDFTADKPELNCRIGDNALHQCNFNLSTEFEKIGELCIYSRHRMDDSKLMLLEVATGCIIYPLNNALLHHNAVARAHRDPLTGLGNRFAMNAALRREVSRANRHESPLSILMIDIDHFKSINDRYGHAAGDRVISSVAEVLKNTAREIDNAFRFGGEEFIVILDGTDNAGASRAAERIRQRIAHLHPEKLELDEHITVSIGCATLQEKETVSELTERADAAMYRAKSGGRNCVCAA